ARRAIGTAPTGVLRGARSLLAIDDRLVPVCSGTEERLDCHRELPAARPALSARPLAIALGNRRPRAHRQRPVRDHRRPRPLARLRPARRPQAALAAASPLAAWGAAGPNRVVRAVRREKIARSFLLALRCASR